MWLFYLVDHKLQLWWSEIFYIHVWSPPRGKIEIVCSSCEFYCGNCCSIGDNKFIWSRSKLNIKIALQRYVQIINTTPTSSVGHFSEIVLFLDYLKLNYFDTWNTWLKQQLFSSVCHKLLWDSYLLLQQLWSPCPGTVCNSDSGVRYL